jgi:hypothetical protein
VRGDVLILLARRLAEDVDLDLACVLRKTSRRDRDAAGQRERLDPAGTSAITLTSSGSPFQCRTSDSRRIGCRISEGSSTSSNCEYFNRYRRWKMVWVSM